MGIESIFKTNILVHDFNTFTANKVKRYYADKIEEVTKKERKEITSVASDFYNREDNEICPLILNDVVDLAKTFLRESGVNIEDAKLEFDNPWVQNYLKWDFHQMHNHLDADVSFCYYIDAEEDCSPIRFYNSNVYNYSATQNFMHEVKPKTGRLVIFPGWLLHEVPQQKTDAKRMITAFNCRVKNV